MSTHESRSPLLPLRNEAYRRIWLASISSNLGGLIQGVGAAWMMASISTSENMVALVQASNTGPIMLLSLIAGAIADSFDRRRVMIAAQLFMIVVSALLTLFALLDLITPWALLAFTFLIGCGTALNNPSWQASVGDIVPRADLPAAVSLNSMGFNITRSVGPAIGGAIVAAAGAAAAFAVNTLSYFAITYALFRWQPNIPKNPLPREQLGSAIGAGLRYVAMSPNLGKVLFRGFVFGLTATAILSLLPIVARDQLLGGPLTFGGLLGAFGLGAIFGALANQRARELLSSEDIVRAAFAGFAVAAGVTGISTSVWITAIALMVAGACWVLALSLFNTVVQLSAPRWVVGRALSLYQTATFGGMATGSWLWGSVAESYGSDHALVASSLLMMVGVFIGFFLPMPAFATLDLDPLNRFNEPALKLDIRPRSGPIVIHVDFEIADEDVPEFLRIMVERRRIRLRDGARNWTLMRDLENPDIWTETYHVPTWVDYVRHNQRRTKADAEITDRLIELHRGDGPPKVHRMIERQAIPPADDVFHQSHIDHH
ncbi:MAG: MFS transporter [Alphaproteobacteria bacterium]|nr:MFS transporter [Alphaproteobacteria bacterium]MBU0835579.1 MFS transporter [Alphaproteobacteria bacterium]MBU1764933.1 MFS transporter [Alphaproteobacteria bacterium]